MSKIIGKVGLYGLPEVGDCGLFIDNLSFSNNLEWAEQRGANGRVCGKQLIDESLGFSLSGNLMKGSSALEWRGAQTLDFISAIVPDIWSETPSAMTCVIDSISHNYTNTDFQKADVSGTVYGFGSSTENE